MASVEEQIITIGHNLLTKGLGVQDSLAAVLQQSFTQKLLSCTLESADGIFIRLGTASETDFNSENKFSASPFLLQKGTTDKHFLFSMTDKKWTVCTSFKTDSYMWLTTIHLDITNNASTPLRSGLFKIADYFSTQCKKHLTQYLLLLSEKCGTTTANTSFEHTLLHLLTAFSSNVKCVMLLDEDGYILQSAGIDSAVAELGSVLSNLFYRSTIELSRLQSTECTAITLSDHEYTIQLLKITGTTLLLAISVSGQNAGTVARFLQHAALSVINVHLKQAGSLCGITYVTPAPQVRKRTSWLSPPTIIPQGNFVAKTGAAVVHLPHCQLLQHVESSQLEWFKTKKSAFEKGLRSCSTCTP